MKIQEIAEICGYEFYGSDCDIRNISYTDIATEDSLAIMQAPEDIVHTRAVAILTEPKYIRTDKTVLLISDPLDIAAVKVAELLIERGEIKRYDTPKYTNVNGYYVASNVRIGEDTVVLPNAFIGEDVKIGKHCVINSNVHIMGGSIIGDDVYIAAGSVIGAEAFCCYYDSGLKRFPGIGKVVLEDQVEIGYHTIIQRGTFSNTVVGKGSKIGNLIDIGHDVRVGNNCKIVSQTGIAGHALIGDGVEIYGQTGIVNHVRIGDYAMVMAQSLVTKNVPDGERVSGRFARKHSEELKRQAKLNRLCEVRGWELLEQ